MKRRTAFAGIAGASSLLAVAALVSPGVTNAATPASHPRTASEGSVVRSSSAPATAVRTSTPHRLTSTRAESIVRKQVPGGHVTDVRRVQHGGYDSFAVRIARTDGSTVTGFIDRDSGVVFDWKQRAAPLAPHATSTTGTDAESADDNGTDDQGDARDSDDSGSDDQGGDSDEQDD